MSQTIIPDLAGAEDVSPTIRRGHLHHRLIAPAEEETGWAPYHGKRVCVSRAGRVRDRHEYLHDSPRGPRCIFCDVIRHSEPLDR